MLIFPLIISCLYNDKKYVIYVTIISVPMIFISHYIAYLLHIVPDEPLVTLKGTLLYGVLPRTIEFLSFSVICYFITNLIEKLITTLAKKNEELYKDQENLIYSLSNIIENKSEKNGAHVRRVAEYTSILVKNLGYDEEETWKISLASMLHDVGKIMVDSKILEKPAKLDESEYNAIKKHTEYGKNLLENTPSELFHLASTIAYEHHQKFDGSGYQGLKGEKISKIARCVALADVFDALSSKRPYKEAWDLEKTYNYIVSEKGKAFDPDIVDTFSEHFSDLIMIKNKYVDPNN